MGINMDTVETYISILQDSLVRKLDIIKEIRKVTTEQSALLEAKEVDADKFNDTLDKKENLIKEMQEIDKGFQSLYDKIGKALGNNASLYKNQILEMQNYIRAITDIGVEIQGVEQKNKVKFNHFLMTSRNEIKEFKKSNKTANSYYRNMSDQHQEWQSYFVDKRQ